MVADGRLTLLEQFAQCPNVQFFPLCQIIKDSQTSLVGEKLEQLHQIVDEIGGDVHRMIAVADFTVLTDCLFRNKKFHDIALFVVKQSGTCSISRSAKSVLMSKLRRASNYATAWPSADLRVTPSNSLETPSLLQTRCFVRFRRASIDSTACGRPEMSSKPRCESDPSFVPMPAAQNVAGS